MIDGTVSGLGMWEAATNDNTNGSCHRPDQQRYRYLRLALCIILLSDKNKSTDE
jgi:hypothetical protein